MLSSVRARDAAGWVRLRISRRNLGSENGCGVEEVVVVVVGGLDCCCGWCSGCAVWCSLAGDVGCSSTLGGTGVVFGGSAIAKGQAGGYGSCWRGG